MTTILFIILGISIGVGCTLIFLQERFIRERRLVLAASESDREKAAQQLTELDEKWELECEQYKQELIALQDQAVSPGALENSELAVREKEARVQELAAENAQLREAVTALQGQLVEAQTESDFLKGEIARLEEDRAQLPPDDFILLSPPGGHLLPGSVARALMKKKGD